MYTAATCLQAYSAYNRVRFAPGNLLTMRIGPTPLRDFDPPMGATAWGDEQAVSRLTAPMINSGSPPKKACEEIFKGKG